MGLLIQSTHIFSVEHVFLLSLSQSLTIDEERRHAVNMGRQGAISFQYICVKWQGFCDAVLDGDIDVVPEMGAGRGVMAWLHDTYSHQAGLDII